MKKLTGFTLIEILLVMGIMATLSAIAGLSLSTLYSKADLNSSQNLLTSELKSQQLKAMAGYAPGSSVAVAHGIYFESDKYTLFSGNEFNPDDPANVPLPASTNVAYSPSNLTDNSIIFLAGSGEVANHLTGAAITITDANTGEMRQVQINLMGSISE